MTNNKTDAETRSQSLLAWAGWKLLMPSEWQPLKLEGNPEKGQIIVGDSTCAMFVVKWERPGRRARSDGEKWVAQRLKKHGVLPQDNPPAADRFTSCGWVNGLQTEEGKETAYWYAYSEEANLVLGVNVNGVLPNHIRKKIIRDVLPTIEAFSPEEYSLWSMYDVSFRAPAGYELSQRHLFSGDIALEFAKNKTDTLMMRQVYPGDLALSRKDHEKWLRSYPFKEHRRVRRDSVRIQRWQHSSRSELSGIQKTAWKRLSPPLGWCAPRKTRAFSVHDSERNRLLVVEHMSKNECDSTVCVNALEMMNSEN